MEITEKRQGIKYILTDGKTYTNRNYLWGVELAIIFPPHICFLVCPRVKFV